MKKTAVGIGVVGALVYFLMGGLGLGIGPGEGESPDESESSAQTDPAPEAKTEPEPTKPKPPPCELRLDRRGLWRNDATLSIDEAANQCREAGRASLTVTGDAKQGDLDDLNRAFDAAGIELLSNR